MPLVRSSTPGMEEGPAVGAPVDRVRLDEGLCCQDIGIRLAAVRDADRQGEAELLAGHLETEESPAVREAILTNLVRIGGAAAARPLVEVLRGSEDTHLRNAVIETLQSMGESVVAELELLLDDPVADLRIYALNIAQSLRSARVPDLALRVLAEDPHVNVCAAAIDVISQVGGPEMIPSLQAAANRFPDDPFLAYAVRATIKRIG